MDMPVSSTHLHFSTKVNTKASLPGVLRFSFLQRGREAAHPVLWGTDKISPEAVCPLLNWCFGKEEVMATIGWWNLTGADTVWTREAAWMVTCSRGGDLQGSTQPLNESSYCCCLGLARITESLFGLDRVKDKYLERDNIWLRKTNRVWMMSYVWKKIGNLWKSCRTGGQAKEREQKNIQQLTGWKG